MNKVETLLFGQAPAQSDSTLPAVDALPVLAISALMIRGLKHGA